MSDGNHLSGRKSNSSGGNNRGSQRGGNNHGNRNSSGSKQGNGQQRSHHHGSSNQQPPPVPPGDVGGSNVPSPVASGSTPTGSPTSQYPSSLPVKDQLLTSGMVHVRYFDEQQGAWGMRRPSTSQNAASTVPKSFVVCNISLGNSERGGAEVERCSSLNDLLSSQAPTFVAMLEMTETFFAAMQQLPMVRRHYALTDLMKFNCSIDGGIRGAEPTIVEHGCVFLIRKPVHVDFAECQPRLFGEKSKERSRPFVLLHMRNFYGMSCTIGAAHFDPCATAEDRCTAVTTAIGKMDVNTDIVALAGNFGDHVSDVKDQELRKDLSDVMRSQGMMDAFEAVSDSVNTAPVSFWLRDGGRAIPASVSPLSDRRWCRFGSIISINIRSGAAAAMASPTGIAIPQPRSAKGVATKGSPSPMVLTDPAVVVVDERLPASIASVGPMPAGAIGTQQSGTRGEGINVATLLQTSIKPRLRFRKDNTFHLKGSNRTLGPDEAPYDITVHFASMHETLDAINSGAFPWVADYFVYNHTIVAAEHVTQCDAKSFRRYAQSKPNPLSLRASQMLAASVDASAMSSLQPFASSTSTSASGVNVMQLLNEKMRRDQQHSAAGSDGEAAALAAYSAAIHSNGMAAPPQPMEARVAVGVNRHHVAIGGASTGNGSVQAAGTQVAIHSNGPVIRTRQWSEAWCTPLYQVTPREMKFDISPLVGLKKGNLSEAIARLNTKKTMAIKLSDKPDKLLDYGFDYALLYCPERQGYWLLACGDVPCDIAACRLAAL